MRKIFSLANLGAAALLLTSLTGCEDVLEQYFPKPTPPPTTPTFPSLGLDIPFYTLSGGTKLDAYSTKDPNTRSSSVAITGLQSGETILAIDFRPATGQLYGISSASRLYVINQKTGAAHAIGAGAFTPAVQGNLVSFDFNPTVDRIRLVTSTGQNLRLNPETGTVAATDGDINGVAGANVTGAAYTNNKAGATTTALYAINTQNQQLYLVNPPNDGKLVPVGSLNLAVSGDGGFDIDAKTGTALGLYTVKGKPTLFSVNLSTGATRPLAEYASNFQYMGLAIPTQPVAYAVDYDYSVNRLLIFNPTNPAVVFTKPITGLATDEIVSGLDFRPANGQLYALATTFPTSTKLYTINAATGAATLVGPINTPLGVDLGFDFNPVADRIRIIKGNTNLRVNPVDASFIIDGPILQKGDPNPLSSANIYSFLFTAAAYDSNFTGSTATTLFAINERTSEFVRITPNTGEYEIISRLGTGASGPYTGFDIGGMSNTGYSIFTERFSAEATLYTIDLQAGKATRLGAFPSSVRGLAIGLGF